MMLGLLLLLQQDSTYTRVETLLAAHDLAAARRLAEQLVTAHPQAARAHVLLGQVWYAWPVIGRYTALEEFRAAARLSQHDPVPLYWQVRVGEYLGSDEGEGIIREAILRIFALTPDYEDCWKLFEGIYHNPVIWRRAEQALAHHPDDPVALERRAQIALALEQPGRADSLAALVLARHDPYVPGFLLRAEADFDAGNDRDGYAWYDSALAYADVDSTGAIWNQVWMIASPAEFQRQDSTPPGERRRFFEWFWARRDPNLVTPENERIAEHFRRLAAVRRMFRLLHPYAAFHHSGVARTLAASYERDTVLGMAKSDSFFDQFSPSRFIMPDLRGTTDTSAQATVYALANLSARGLVWLRHGRPDVWERQEDGFLATHTWTYNTSDGPLTISFEGIPGPFHSHHGDYIVAPPVNAREARAVQGLLTSDGTSLPATLEARGWSAFFMSSDGENTAFFVKTAPGASAVVLRDTVLESEIVAARGTGLLELIAPPGPYRLALDVDSGGSVGRIRGRVRLPSFSWETLGVSSLVLAPGDSLGDRGAALAGMPADLTYPAGRALAAYAELYGLSRDSDGRARYRVSYSFAPLRSSLARLFGRAAPVVLAFDREGEWRGATPERLVIEPGRLPPGRYRVTLSVTDLPTNVKSETVALDITIR
jgi:hypothetical protein